MKKSIITLALFAVSVAFIISCSKQPSKSTTAKGVKTLELPTNLQNYSEFNFNVNPAKATLGRVLFYDEHLSKNNSVSCGSCHVQKAGFAQNIAFSKGLDNLPTQRNTMPIHNLSLDAENPFGFFPTTQPLFWDSRENNLTQLALRPVTNHVEMGISDVNSLLVKLNALPYYKQLVTDAFGQEQLDANNMASALANFMASIRSTQSRFDKFIAGNTNAITAKEKQGFALFTSVQYQCNSCHTSMLLGANINQGGNPYGNDSVSNESNFANIGLSNNNNADAGKGAVTKNSKDMGRFKVPDLHNVALTAPYMHNGSLATLNDVIEHYSHNIMQNPNLDNRLKNSNGTARNMNIPEADKEALIAFLNSLTDNTLINDPKYSNPFVIK
jgi:cytochrome c peroxidase